MPDEATAMPNSVPNSEGAGTGADAGADPVTPAAAAAAVISREAYQALQSRADRAEADARRAREAAEQAAATAREQTYQVTLANLAPDERAAATAKWQIDEERRALAAERQDLEATARTIAMQKLSIDYGVNPTDLENCTDVNDMRARAAELKAERLDQELATLRAGGQVQPAAAAGIPAAMRAAPPAAGTGGDRSFDATSFKGTGKAADYLKAKRAAGAEEAVSIPLN